MFFFIDFLMASSKRTAGHANCSCYTCFSFKTVNLSLLKNMMLGVKLISILNVLKMNFRCFDFLIAFFKRTAGHANSLRCICFNFKTVNVCLRKRVMLGLKLISILGVPGKYRCFDHNGTKTSCFVIFLLF